MFPQLAPARRSGRRVSHSIIERLYQTANPLVMVQAQDILGLGSGARVNTPGTVGGRNWRWKLDSPLDARSAEELRVLSEQSGRRAPRCTVAAAA